MTRTRKYTHSLSMVLFIASFTGLIWANMAHGEQADGKETISFFLELPEDALSLTHGTPGGIIKPFPEGIKSLHNTDLANTLALTSRLRNNDGKLVGLASELEDFSVALQNDGKQIWDTYWTLMIVGRGTIFLYEKESLGPEVAAVFFNTPLGDKDWEGHLTLPSNMGPHASGHGIIVGGTGEFANRSGTFEEIGTLLKFTTSSEITASLELRIHFDPRTEK